MKEVTVYTDGGCLGNPGPGGWAAVLMYGAERKEISGRNPATTNNRMELQAAIEALSALKQPCRVTLFSDSQYVRNGITLWVHGWKRNGWRSKKKTGIKNVDLWQQLDAAASQHQILWKWLRGHVGHEYNERCDALAGAEMAAIQREYTPTQLRELLARFNREQAAATAGQFLPGPG